MQPTDSHRNISWTIVILLFSQINLDPEDMDTGGSPGLKPPNQKKQTAEFLGLLRNLPIEKGNSVFVIYNEVNVLNTSSQNDHTEIFRLEPKSRQLQSLKTDATAGIFQSAEKMAAILKVIQPQIPESDNLLLMSWDHGSVYGIFKKFNVPVGTTAAAAAGVAMFVDLLTPNELAEAICQGLKRKVDLLVMMNCWMQNIHTLYGLRKAAKIMVASEGLLTSFVYNYRIFSKLKNKNVLAVADEFTKNLLPKYTYKYASTYKLDNLVPTCSVFTTIFNAALDQFIDGVEKLTVKLIDLLTNDPNATLISLHLYDAWNSVFKWDWAESDGFNYFMVDFVAFVTAFSNTITTDTTFSNNVEVQSLPADVKALAQLLPSFNPHPNIGPNPYGNAGSTVHWGNPTGTGIFFPQTKQNYHDSFYVKHLQNANQIAYYTNGNPNWLVFLLKFYAVYP